jgi:2-keto-4-pentenoate hydratase
VNLGGLNTDAVADDAAVTDLAGTTGVASAGVTTVDGALVRLGSAGGLPAARTGDSVTNEIIQTGSTVDLTS